MSLAKMKIVQTYDKQGQSISDTQSIDIVADDGGTLFTLSVSEEGVLEIATSGAVKHNGKVLDTGILIVPKCSNVIKVQREIYQP